MFVLSTVDQAGCLLQSALCGWGLETDPLSLSTQPAMCLARKSLFYADSSIFSRITNGNLHALSVIVGEKAADHILDLASLRSVYEDSFRHPS